MRQHRIPTAAATLLGGFLLLGSLLATPASAAEGDLVLGVNSDDPTVLTDPPDGECVTFDPVDGSTGIENRTDGIVELYAEDCDADPLTVLAPNQGEEFEDPVEIGAFMILN